MRIYTGKNISKEILYPTKNLLVYQLVLMYNNNWHSHNNHKNVVLQSHGLLSCRRHKFCQPLAKFLNSHWHDCSRFIGVILQQSLAWFLNSHWYCSSPVAGTILLQSLAQLFSRHWRDCLTVAGTIVQQSLS